MEQAPFQILEATIDSIHSAYKSGQLTCAAERDARIKRIFEDLTRSLNITTRVRSFWRSG